MEVHGKKLDDRGVACARRSFEKGVGGNRRRKITLSFDEFLDHFANDCMSFKDVAQIACKGGVSRERIRQLYERYFRQLFPAKRTGQERQQICGLKRRRVAEKVAKHDFSGNSSLAKVARYAKEAGCTVERVVSRKRGQVAVSHRLLSVNGMPYQVYCTRNVSRPSVRCIARYSHVGVLKQSLHRVAGIIVLQEDVGSTDRIFIIPTRDVLDAYGSHERRSLSLFIPTESRPVYQNSQPRLAWGKYEDAWPRAQGKTSQVDADDLARGR